MLGISVSQIFFGLNVYKHLIAGSARWLVVQTTHPGMFTARFCSAGLTARPARHFECAHAFMEYCEFFFFSYFREWYSIMHYIRVPGR